MFLLAILIGLYSFSIFFLGITGLINEFYIGLTLLILLIIISYAFIKHLESLRSLYIQAKKNFFYFIIFFTLVLINFIGVLGPELGFDALWYHLTIPKLYIEWKSIKFIPGGLLYYSAMPKLIDLLYVPALIFSNEIAAKFIHFLFGVLTSIVTYKITNLFVNKKLSYLAVVIFYSNLVVGWLSITAYIDLGRAFFASLAIYFFLLHYKLKEIRYLYFSAILVGFEIVSKFLGVSTLFSLLLVLFIFPNKLNFVSNLKTSLVFVIIPLVIVSPWFLFSYINTNSLFYPFFTKIYPSEISLSSLNPFLIIKDTFNLFLYSPDPILPIYLISLPLLIIMFRIMPKTLRVLAVILLINIVIWNFIPQKNSRFIVPYLPIFSVLVVWIISKSSQPIKNTLYLFVFLSVFVSMVYRGIANTKYLPVLFGTESKEKFLEKNLNFSFGDYLDIDSRVSEIVGDEKVLIKGIHNLYYIDFRFDHDSWANEKEYKYILSRGVLSGEKDYNLVYKEELTGTYLYEKN